jgi:hypothetical protein
VEVREWQFEASPGKVSTGPYQKINKNNNKNPQLKSKRTSGGGGVSSGRGLAYKLGVLSSMASTAKTTKNRYTNLNNRT